MKCRHFFSFALVAFLSFFFGSFITTYNTYADSPSFEVHKGDSTVFCFNNRPSISPYNCSDFSYLGITSPSTKSNSVTARFYLGGDLVISSVFISPGYTIYFPISSSTNLIQFADFYLNSGQVSDSDYITFTLVDSLGSPPPSGNLDIISNGTYDVTSYAQATVNVPAETIQGDYHDDLVNINQSIIVCGAILLVLYFFYCIYRLIIKNSGVH